MADHTTHLPDEILAKVLESFPQENLRTVAGTSRRFRIIAYRYAGLRVGFIYRYCAWREHNCELLAGAVEYVRAQSLRLDLVVNCHCAPGLAPSDPPISPAEVFRLFSLIPSALSVVHDLYLSIDLVPALCPMLWEALRYPAPYICSLRIAHTSMMSDWIIPAAGIIPADLFSGHCPLLHTVALRDVFLGIHTAAAFSGVDRLFMFCTSRDYIPRPIDVGLHFPKLRDLGITSGFGFSSDATAGVDFRSLSHLQRLSFKDNISQGMGLTYSMRKQSLTRTAPVVWQYCWFDPWFRQHWESIDECLSLRVRGTEYDLAEAAITYGMPRLYRIFCFENGEDSDIGPPVYRMYELAFLTDLFVYIRIENSFLVDLFWFDCTLPRLQRLHIDLDGRAGAEHAAMLWPPYHSPDGYENAHYSDDEEVQEHERTDGLDERKLLSLPCPVLEELVILAQHASLTVSSREAAHLGHALRQPTSATQQPPRLVLFGSTFAPHEPLADRELLDLVFSTVVTEPFGLSDPDGTLWEPCLERSLCDEFITSSFY